MDDNTPASLAELGQRLAALRVANEWSIDEVAQRLHLPSGQVQNLEQGAGNESPVYLKGFLKSYARLVGAPESMVDDAMRISETPVLLPAAGAVARRVSWLERYKWAGTYAVGTALALTAVNWLVTNTPQLGVPDAPRIAIPAPTPNVPIPTSVKPEPLPAPVPEAPLIASLSPFASREAVRPATPVQNVLDMRFEQDSWVEVTNAAGDRLLYSVVKAGDRRTFDGGPLSVRIGNVRGVAVDVNGQSLDLSGYARGNVARFDVTASGDGWQAKQRGASSESSDG